MLESFLERMRSRKLVEWTIGYLAAGFALLQLADFLKDAFSWPTVVLRVLTVVVAFGFFAAITVAWYHGEKGHQRAPTTEIALLTMIAASTVAMSWYVGVTTPDATAEPPLTSAPPAGETRLALNDPAVAPASIAVLPFVNMTPDGQNDYLTDGITEDIITELGKIQGLRVISRTSVMRYRDSDKSIREIAGELGVGTVLEGSVRVQGNQVRIVAQLIDASTDTHLWAETYDRDIKDILAVQSEVARAIAAALNAQLLPSALASNPEIPAVDPDAYRQYQKAKSMANTTDETERSLAVAMLDSVIAKAPDFGPAYSARMDLQVPVIMDGSEVGQLPDSDFISNVETRVQVAGEPSQARASINMIRALRSRDIEAAERAARQAIQSNPNSVPDRIRYAQILYASGKPEDALTEIKAAESVDPMSPVVHSQIGEFMTAAGHNAEAERYLRRAVELDSTSVGARIALGAFLTDQGRYPEAIRELEAARRRAPRDPAVLGPLGFALARDGKEDQAKEIARQLERSEHRGRMTGAAQVYAGLGETQQAMEWLRRSLGDNGRGAQFMFLSPRMHQQLERMRKNPELARVLDSLNVRFQFVTVDSVRLKQPPAPPGSGSRSGGRR